MRVLRGLLLPMLAAVLAPLAPAQDKVTLINGDVLTGQIATLAEGTLTIRSPLLGDVKVPFDQVATIATQEPVELLTTSGERLRRRIIGIDQGQLQLAGAGPGEPPVPTLQIASLAKINPAADEPPKWTGSLTVNGSFNNGNTDRRSIGSSLEAVRRTDVDRFNLDAVWDYGEDKDLGTWRLTQRRVGGGLKYDYFLSERVYALANTRALGDTLADLQLRFTAGAGLGYQFYDTETLDVTGEAGLSYLNENYRSAAPSVDYVAARLAYKIRWAMTEATRIVHGIEAYPSLESGDDVYFTMDTRVQTDLTASMIAQLQWTWDYDNTPSPGLERSDHRLLLSVGWKF